MEIKKQYLELKKELSELKRFDLVIKLIDLFYDTKKESFSNGMDSVTEIYKKYNQ